MNFLNHFYGGGDIVQSLDIYNKHKETEIIYQLFINYYINN